MAQLKVSSTGNVGIGISDSPISQFAIGESGNQYAKAYIEGDGYALQIKSLGKSSVMPSNFCGVGVKVIGSARVPLGNIGVHSTITGTYAATDNGFAVGVLGSVGNGSNGYNYGVSGLLTGARNGAAIFGSVSGNGYSTYIPGRYAGYFDGNVEINGNLRMWMHSIYLMGNSDFMQNLQPMGNMLNRLTSLNPVVFKNAGISDSIYAFTAQNMGSVFPHLVDNSNSDVNYTGMIPILVEAIKELQTEVENLQSLISNNRRTSLNDINAISYANSCVNAVLYQNRPNPFSERTEIRFLLPENATNAQICIFDMTGKMLKKIPISASEHSVYVNGYELGDGIYLYSLVINGQEIDTKRMVLSN